MNCELVIIPGKYVQTSLEFASATRKLDCLPCIEILYLAEFTCQVIKHHLEYCAVTSVTKH